MFLPVVVAAAVVVVVVVAVYHPDLSKCRICSSYENHPDHSVNYHSCHYDYPVIEMLILSVRTDRKRLVSLDLTQCNRGVCSDPLCFVAAVKNRWRSMSSPPFVYHSMSRHHGSHAVDCLRIVVYFLF